MANGFKSFLIIVILASFTVRAKTLMAVFAFTKPTNRKSIVAHRTSLVSFIYRMFSMMARCMNSMLGKFKIFYSIIEFVTINMVNNFTGKRLQLSTKMLFHDKSMLHNKLIADPYLFISIFSYVSFSICSCFSNVRRTIFIISLPMKRAISFAVVFSITISKFACFHMASISNKIVFVYGGIF